jgi:hypothetical protein
MLSSASPTLTQSSLGEGPADHGPFGDVTTSQSTPSILLGRRDVWWLPKLHGGGLGSHVRIPGVQFSGRLSPLTLRGRIFYHTATRRHPFHSQNSHSILSSRVARSAGALSIPGSSYEVIAPNAFLLTALKRPSRPRPFGGTQPAHLGLMRAMPSLT